MRRVVSVVALLGLAAMFLFVGCQGGGAVAAVTQQLEEIGNKLTQIEQNNGAMQAKITELEKTINDLKTNHPELFQQAAQAQQTTTTTTQKGQTTTKKKTGTAKRNKKGKGARVK